MTETPYKRVLVSDKTNKKFISITDEFDYHRHLYRLDEKGVFFEIVGLEQFQVKPYFDLDPKGDFDAKLYDNFEEDLKKIYNAPIAKMGRETREENGVIKHSRRFYLLNCKITYHLIPIYFKDLFDKYGKNGLKILDDGIYNKNRKFYLPLSSKKIRQEDKKVISFSVPKLELIEGSIFDNCSTYIEEDYFDLDKDLLDKTKKQFQEIKQNDIKKKEEQKQEQKQEQKEEEEEEEEEEEDNDIDKYEKLNKIIQLLSPQRADDYNDWLNVMFCIINISKKEKISKRKMYELIHLFSKKSSKYNETETDNKIDMNLENNTTNKLGWNYLYNTCIKEDNKDYYDMINKNYKNVKKNFEEDHLKIIHPPMIIYTNREGENIKESFKDVRCSYSHLSYNKKEEDKKGNIKYKKTKFINDWLDDDKIRMCESVCFKPPSYERNFVNIPYKATPEIQLNNYEYNLWTHYEILKTPYYNDTEEDKEFNKKVMDNLFDFMNNIYDNNKGVIDYLLAYFANRLQKPYQRNKICIIVKGTEGDGKNTFFDIIKAIVGRKYYSEIETAKQIFDSHSTTEDCKLFVCLNEANPKDNYENSERLKSRITTDTILINPKNISPYEIDNRCDYLMTTNNENPVKIDEGSRRYLLIKTSPHYKGNIDFFNNFYKNIIENKRALRVIYEYLINYDVCSVVPSLNFQDDRYIPKTEYQKQVINENKDRILLFLEDLTLKNKHFEDKKKYTNQSFFAEWTEWVKSNNYKIDINNISFGTRLMLLVKKHKIEGYITKDQNKNTIVNFKELFKHFNFIQEKDE